MLDGMLDRYVRYNIRRYEKYIRRYDKKYQKKFLIEYRKI